MKRDDVVYGYPCVENPHNFSPDRECCSDAEIEFWEDAKRRWSAGERDVRGARCITKSDHMGNSIHMTRTSWGIGVNNITIDDETGEFGEPED